MKLNTLTSYLQFYSRERPEALYARYVFPDREPVEITYGETARRSRQFAHLYAQHGIGADDVVLIILPFHEDVMAAFYGAMWLGAIPALLPVPTGKLTQAQYDSNLKILFERTQPRAIVTDPMLRDELAGLLRDDREPPVLLPLHDVESAGIYGDPSPRAEEDIALMQYSSGSTGLQKGILLSHRAVLAQIEGVSAFFELTERDHILSWIPLYHDWGLIGIALHSLQLGTHFTLISPMHWVMRPVVACEAIHRYRPTAYYQPNFAFNYMAQRVRDEEMAGLDLASIRICCSGGEPCLYESHRMFAERFAAWGYEPASYSIVYGAAEVTCGVVGAGHREPVQIDGIDRHRFQTTHQARPVPSDHPNRMRVVGVGRGLSGTQLAIFDEQCQMLPDRQVGEIAIMSRAQSHGYYRNPEATARVNYQGWYLTGDLGYLVGNTLFVTGRKSDLIIVGGVNIYPQDVEHIAEEHGAVVTGRVLALGVDDPEHGTQKLVVVAESRATEPHVHNDILHFIRSEVAMRLGVQVDHGYVAPNRWLLKTSSGKIARIPNCQRLHELDGMWRQAVV